MTSYSPHKTAATDERHPDILWTPADEAERLAIDVDDDELPGVAWQRDNNTFWRAVENSPTVTWIEQAGGGGGVTDHGALSGLADDDHTQYLLGDGTRAMTGALDMGSFAITNVGDVDGRDVSADGSALDSHTGDATIHYTVGSISHTSITGIGTNTHAQIDTHIAASNPHSGSAATVHTHTEADITDLDHTDADAIHDNEAGEIAALTQKAIPSVNDYILIEDSAAGNAKRYVLVGDLPGGGGVTDHGALSGLADDDHTQYLLGDGTRAMTGALNMGTFAITNVGDVDGRDVSADGSTLDSHTGDATIHYTVGSISHTSITGIGTNTHAQIDTHIAAANPHSGSASTVHTHNEADITDLDHTDPDAIHDNVSGEIAALTQKAIPSVNDYILIEDSAAANAKRYVLVGDLPGGGGVTDHGALSGLADDDHTQYLLADGTRAMAGALDMGSFAITNVGDVDGRDVSADGSTLDSHTGDATIHYTVASIDHGSITGIGTNTHAQIDTHIAASNPHSGSASSSDLTTHTGDATIHYTVGSIDHGSIAGLADDDHTQYLLADGTRAMSGNLDLNNNAIENQNVAPGDLANGEYYSFGPTVSVTVTENTNGAGSVLAVSFANGQYYDANASDGDGQIDFPVLSVESGTGTRRVMPRGLYRNTSWSWTAGGELWISNTNGTMTQTQPVSPNYQKSVGFALTTDTIYFDPRGSEVKITT